MYISVDLYFMCNILITPVILSLSFCTVIVLSMSVFSIKVNFTSPDLILHSLISTRLHHYQNVKYKKYNDDINIYLKDLELQLLDLRDHKNQLEETSFMVCEENEEKLKTINTQEEVYIDDCYFWKYIRNYVFYQVTTQVKQCSFLYDLWLQLWKIIILNIL